MFQSHPHTSSNKRKSKRFGSKSMNVRVSKSHKKSHGLLTFVWKPSNTVDPSYFTELINWTNNDKIVWDETHKIWEFYWKSDGPRRVHQHFSCKEMYHRHERYFKKSNEYIMFKRISDECWLSSEHYDLVKELKKSNEKIMKYPHPLEL